MMSFLWAGFYTVHAHSTLLFLSKKEAGSWEFASNCASLHWEEVRPGKTASFPICFDEAYFGFALSCVLQTLN
jgi:hypothetical protein